MATAEEAKLRRELGRSRAWTRVLVLALAAVSVLAGVLWREDRPTCPVVLHPDGTWQRTETEGQVLDGCKVVVVER